MDSNFDLACAWNSNWLINGERPKRQTREYLNESVNEQLEYKSAGSCPYCNHTLKHKSHKHYEGNESRRVEELEGQLLTRHYILSFCCRCSYWTINGYEGGTACMDPVFLMAAASVTAKFTIVAPHGCSEELAQHLRRKPELWHCLAPTRMETLVADIFKANHEHCEVKHIGGPGDLGVDVLFIDNNSTKWLIQVKRREKPNKAESFSTLQSILGTMALQGERHGIIVSTADYFSYQAKREVRNAQKQGFTVELIDKGLLDRMVGRLLLRSPWKTVFTHPDTVNIMKDLQGNFMNIYRNTVGIGKINDVEAAKLDGVDASPAFVDPNQLNLFT